MGKWEKVRKGAGERLITDISLNINSKTRVARYAASWWKESDFTLCLMEQK